MLTDFHVVWEPILNQRLKVKTVKIKRMLLMEMEE